MFIPPPEPQKIVAVVEERVCAPADLPCRIDMANDVLDGVSRAFQAARSSSSGDVIASGRDGARAGDSATATVTGAA